MVRSKANYLLGVSFETDTQPGSRADLRKKPRRPLTSTLDIMKIPALRVEVNGELIAIAVAEDISFLTGQVGFGASKNQAINTSQVMFIVMGLDVNRD